MMERANELLTVMAPNTAFDCLLFAGLFFLRKNLIANFVSPVAHLDISAETLQFVPAARQPRTKIIWTCYEGQNIHQGVLALLGLVDGSDNGCQPSKHDDCGDSNKPADIFEYLL